MAAGGGEGGDDAAGTGHETGFGGQGGVSIGGDEGGAVPDGLVGRFELVVGEGHVKTDDDGVRLLFAVLDGVEGGAGEELLAKGGHADDVDAGAVRERAFQVGAGGAGRGDDGGGGDIESHRGQLVLVGRGGGHGVVGGEHDGALAECQGVEEFLDAGEELGATVDDAVHVEDPGFGVAETA
ncbi:MAG: hypothetical protein K0Q71_5258 [Thermomicrobiales bacterium]|nr:hypothetical protein [Thermomicrobiales bacterium]